MIRNCNFPHTIFSTTPFHIQNSNFLRSIFQKAFWFWQICSFGLKNSTLAKSTGQKLYLQHLGASRPAAPAAAVATSQTRMTLINIYLSLNLDEIMSIMM